jgi:hypothetical protein
VAAGEIQRLVINIPPGLREVAARRVLWPAWMWTWRPGWRSIFSSYDDTLSTRDSVRSRTVMQSDVVPRDVRAAVALHVDQNVKGYYRNSRMGERLATSVDGKRRGSAGTASSSTIRSARRSATSVNELEKRRRLVGQGHELAPERSAHRRRA